MADYWWVFVGAWMNGFGIGWLSLCAINVLLEKKLCRSHRKAALDDGGDPGALYGSPGMRVGLDASDPEFDSQSPLLGRKKTLLQSLEDGDFNFNGGDSDISEWLFKSYAAHRERDEALLKSLRQRRESLLAHCREARKKAPTLFKINSRWAYQELLADLDALEKEIRQTF